MPDNTVVWAVWQDASLALPKDSGRYLVWVHAPLRGFLSPIFSGEGYTTVGFFDRGGCIWSTEDEAEHYNACLTVVDRDAAYHVSHWMPMPTGPEDRA